MGCSMACMQQLQASQAAGMKTAPLTVRSLLFPINMMVMLGLACCRASSNQLARWLKVSRLHGHAQLSMQQQACNMQDHMWRSGLLVQHQFQRCLQHAASGTGIWFIHAQKVELLTRDKPCTHKCTGLQLEVA